MPSSATFNPPAPATDRSIRSLVVLVGLHVVAWAWMQWMSSGGNLDGYHDMLENYAWSHSWLQGTYKHPPLFAWTVKLWFGVFPVNALSYFTLSYVNVAVGLAGVALLAHQLGLGRWASTAVLLLLWSLPYTTLASKFNANSQLLSLWPWTAALLVASMRQPGVGRSILLGLLCAASMLAKYFSGVFLLGLLLATMACPPGRRWLASRYFAFTVLSLALALLPHILWLMRNDYPTLRYAMEQGGGTVGWLGLVKFALSPLFYWAPAWIALVSTARWHAGDAPRPGWWTLARLSWHSQGRDDLLFWLAITPGGITLLCGMAELAELSVPWSIPIGFAFSLLWLRNLAPWLPQASLARLHRAAWPVLLVLAGVVTPLLTGWRAYHEDKGYYRPDEAAARSIVAGWDARHPGARLRWVGGEWAHNGILPFYAGSAIRAVPGVPDGAEAAIDPVEGWAEQPGLLLCPLGPLSEKDAGPDALQAKTDQQGCVQDMQKWLQANSRPARLIAVTVSRPASWRFPHPLPYGYAVFDVLPRP